MSTDTNKTNNMPDPEAENNASHALSAKDKFVSFVQENKKILLGVAAFIIILIICFILYSTFVRKSMDSLADEFCACASAEGSDFYAYSKDGFGYRSDLVGCFAEDFRNYGESYNKATKKALLMDFQQAVIKKCPEKLVGIFEYK